MQSLRVCQATPDPEIIFVILGFFLNSQMRILNHIHFIDLIKVTQLVSNGI